VASYVLRRIFMLIPVLLGVSILVFLIVHLSPGDPARLMLGERAPVEQLEALREQLGLNDPLPIQYVKWLGRIVKLDFGRSIRSNRPVVEEIAARLPATAELAVAATVLAILIGVPVGILSAVRPNSIFDDVATLGALAGIAMPVFWQGIMLMLIFSVHLEWLPSSGRGDGWQYYVLPAVTLGTGAAASITRMTRSTMLETLGQDYVRTARAKGLAERLVVYRHALRNALLPIVTIIGLEFGGLMAGAVITETIFAWPGVGRYAVDAIRSRDFPAVQGIILTFALIYALINLIVDVLYAYLDPRLQVRYD